MYQLTGDEFFINSEKAIATEIRSPQDNYPEHSHDFQELIIVSKGSGTHVLNDSPNHISQNQICFVNPKDRHLFEDVNNLHLSNILFVKNAISIPAGLKDFIPSNDLDLKSWHISISSMEHINILVHKLDQEIKSKNIGSDLMAQSLFQQVILELHRGKVSYVGSAKVDDKVLLALEWIKYNYKDELNLSEISDKFELPSRTLSRRIKDMTDLSFNNYVHKIRINTAIKLLQYSDASITDIAFKVGYSDSNYFSTRFKKITSKSPSAYR